MTFLSRPYLANFLVIALLMAMTSSSSSPAMAAEINDKGAAQLKSMLSSYIDNYRASVKSAGGDLITDGEISIEQGSNYYAATLPATTYKTVAQSNVKIGLIAINAVPTDDDDKWKITLAIPTPILVTDKNDIVTKRVDIGNQKMGGIWSAKLENFAKLSADYNDLKLTFVDNGDFINVNNVKVQSDLKETSKDLWSGPTNIVLNNLTGGSKEVQEEVSFKEMAVKIDVENFSHLDQKNALDKLASIDENSADLSNILLQLIKSSGNFDSNVTIKDIKINDTINQKNPITGIDLVKLGFKSNTGAGDKIDQGFNISYSGLSYKDDVKSTSLVPQEFGMALSLDNFPFAEVMNFAGETLGNGNAKSAKQVAATRAMNELPQKFKDAGTVLTLKGIDLKNAQYSVAIDGLLKAEPKSQIGGIGNLNIVTTGLDKIMTELDKAPNAAIIKQPLTMFRLMSEQKGNKNTARFKLEENGRVSINGKDMGINAGSSAAPAQ